MMPWAASLNQLEAVFLTETSYLATQHHWTCTLMSVVNSQRSLRLIAPGLFPEHLPSTSRETKSVVIWRVGNETQNSAFLTQHCLFYFICHEHSLSHTLNCTWQSCMDSLDCRLCRKPQEATEQQAYIWYFKETSIISFYFYLRRD